MTPRGFWLLLLFALAAGTPACSSPRAKAGDIEVLLRVDGADQRIAIPAGSTVQQALDLVGLQLGALDRVEPPPYTLLSDGTVLSINRVLERFEVETLVVPFERQTIRNEALPAGESRLLQSGENGEQEITYRVLVESHGEVSRTPIKTVLVREPRPEITMLGAQQAFAPVTMEGTLAYLSGGNAWIMQETSANRRPITLSADLDGRVFRLSPDGEWLLFSRQAAPDSSEINSLWVVQVAEPLEDPLPLGVENVVHFADWSPNISASSRYVIAFTTVEPRSSPPGWQANNDLSTLTLSNAGAVVSRQIVLDSNAGGQYGWWGSSFLWSPAGDTLAYARADAVGWLSVGDGQSVPLLELIPFEPPGDWAWVPGLAWSSDGATIYFVNHTFLPGASSPERSPVFDLTAIHPTSGLLLPLVERTGMFANPSVPSAELGSTNTGLLAFYQALDPFDSEKSHYSIAVADRDGSNRRILFPPAGELGLQPNRLVWSPDGTLIAVSYREDLWIIDVNSGHAERLTSDGNVIAYDWKP